MSQKIISKNQGLIFNLISSIVALFVSFMINFFLSPYIVKVLGVEANGFITLANNFVSYASLASIALNSMSGRFITIKIHQNDVCGANRFYTTVTLGNFVLSICMLIPSILCDIYLENLIIIPANLLWDIKLLFALLFFNFLLSTAFSSLGTAIFVTNNLYIQSMITMWSQILRVIIIIGLFILFQPAVYYIGIATLASTIFATYFILHYKQTLLPELHILKNDFDIRTLFELLSSGIWNTINITGQILLSGLDLLITNLFIGPTEMGVLALAKTLPNVLQQLAATISSIFIPTLTINYAKGNLEGLENELKKGMKITSVLLTTPVSIIIVFADKFYKLWVPSQNAHLLQILTVLTCFGFAFTCSIQCLYNVFSVVNKLKAYSMFILLSGIVNTAVVFILLNTTNLGVYVVAGVSSVINLIRHIFYTVPFAAKYLKLKWNTFIPEITYSIISVLLCILVGFAIKSLVVLNSWLSLIVIIGLFAIVSFSINAFIMLNSDERKYLLDTIYHRKKGHIQYE